MLGHLVPCGGGKSMTLNKTQMVIGRRNPASDGTMTAVNDVELRFVDGWWFVKKVESGRPLAVNGKECDGAQLKPNDVLTIGGKFFRIVYQSPVVLPPASASPNPAPAVKPLAAAPAITAASPVRTATLMGTPSSSPVRDVVPPPPATSPKPPQAAQVTLGMLIPCGGGLPLPLRKPNIVIGRSRTCDVVLPQRDVSAKHCSLDLLRGYWQMADLDSTNGTTVDGMNYRRKWILPGSILGVPGKRYRLDYKPLGVPPSLEDDDEIVPPSRSLMELAGIMDRLVQTLPADEQTRLRWKLD